MIVSIEAPDGSPMTTAFTISLQAPSTRCAQPLLGPTSYPSLTNASRCRRTHSGTAIGTKPDSPGDAAYGVATNARSSGCRSINRSIAPIRAPALGPIAVCAVRKDLRLLRHSNFGATATSGFAGRSCSLRCPGTSRYSPPRRRGTSFPSRRCRPRPQPATGSGRDPFRRPGR
jgi:hypothetical protein